MKLKDGEVACHKCGGTGKLKEWGMREGFRVTPECHVCHGEGKLDWIERVIGKEPYYNPIYGSTEKMAKEIADEIDKEIIASVIKESEKQTMEQMIKEEGKKIDNRIFSKLVLHTPTEQKFKGEKD